MKIQEQQGYTIIGTMIIMMIMSYMGANVVDVSDNGSLGGVKDVQATQALYVGDGGIQYALKELDEGKNPDATRIVGNGEFTVTSNPVSREVHVVAMVGDAKREQSVLASFSADKVDVNLEAALPSGNEITDINFVKTAGSKVILTDVAVNWNWSDCVFNDSCEGDDPRYVCHVPNGKEDHKHTIRVSQSSLEKHLDHGDTLGKCFPNEQVTGRSCDGTDAELNECQPNTGGQSVSQISFDGGSIFNGSASPGEKIDINDLELTEDRQYSFDFVRFSGTVPDTGWYSLTMYFADGSEYTSEFKFINEMSDSDDVDDEFDDDN